MFSWTFFNIMVDGYWSISRFFGSTTLVLLFHLALSIIGGFCFGSSVNVVDWGWSGSLSTWTWASSSVSADAACCSSYSTSWETDPVLIATSANSRGDGYRLPLGSNVWSFGASESLTSISISSSDLFGVCTWFLSLELDADLAIHRLL